MTGAIAGAALNNDATAPMGLGLAGALVRAGLRSAVTAAGEDDRGRISLVCDLTALHPAEARPFALLRWTAVSNRDGRPDAWLLTARPVSPLAAMGLLVPGCLSRRIDRTPGFARAEAFGLGRMEGRIETPGPIDTVCDQTVEALSTGHYVMALRQEWQGVTASLDTTVPEDRMLTRHLISA